MRCPCWQASTSAAATYTVVPWTNTGFSKPIGSGCDGINGGQTIPFKFQIWSGATQVTSVSAIRSIVVEKVASCAATSGTSVYVASPGATTLRYDARHDRFVRISDGVVFRDNGRGSFVASNGDELEPGWKTYIGFHNFGKDASVLMVASVTT